MMFNRPASLLVWSPRVLGILVCLFLSIFALDAVSEQKTFLEGLRDFLVHLRPMLVLLGIVALSWRWEWIGGAAFTGLAVLYAYWAYFVKGHPAWIPIVGGPLLVAGVLFFLSWRHRRRSYDT